MALTALSVNWSRATGTLAVIAALCLAPASAQEVTVEKIDLVSQAIAGNLEGNDPTRDVLVYLPPSYSTDTDRRYPVVYGLHGYSIDNEIWSGEIDAPASIAGAFENGTPEMIVVLPDSRSLHNGSMYSSSVTSGDWETYITEELVAFIDGHYRTIPARESRGLAGHSMGGYGTLRLGMKRPDVFASLYSMSPCCLSARGAPPADLLTKLTAIEDPAETLEMGFFERATLAVGSAWSPNPQNPPLFMDLPGEDTAASVQARWAANAPLAMLDQYVFALRKYDAIAIDVGDQDGLKVDAEEMHRLMTANDIDATFEIYPGDHVSGVADRFENHVLPFFAATLAFE